jgi:ankyrin repeat protein
MTAALLWWIIGGAAVFVALAGIGVLIALKAPLWGVNSPNLHTAAIHWSEDIEPLIRAGHDVNALQGGETPLSKAVTFRKVESVRLLLKNGADPDLAGPGHKLPLASPFLTHRDPDSLRILDMLLDAGADPNVHGSFGRTPLHTAAEDGRLALARKLIAAGADVEARDELGERTPLHLAVANGSPQVAAELLAAGADVNSQDANGMTPLKIAVQNANEPLVELLLQAGSETTFEGWSQDYVEQQAGTPKIRELLRQQREAGASR